MEEKSKIYIIPSNYIEPGYVLNGAVAIRNFVEGCVLAFLGFLLCKILPIPGGVDAITYYILFMFPPLALGIYGIAGDPVSVYLMDVYHWQKRRRPYLYTTHTEAFDFSAADVLLEEPQLRDYLANSVDKVKKAMAGKAVQYIEGQTFQFAVDPEQEALRAAQERREELEEAAKENAAQLENTDKASDALPVSQQSSQPSGQLDVANLVAGIQLHNPEATEDVN